MLADWTKPILMIGCGTMAGSILARWIDSGLSPARVHVVDPSGRPVPSGVVASTHAPDRIAPGTVVMLGFKPQQFGQIAPGLNAALGADCAIVSMLAGLPVAQLRAGLSKAGAIVRIMPNLPVRSGEGVVLTCRELNGATDTDVDRLLAPLGLVEPLAEADFDLGTALSGCGPAYLYRFVDALAVAATRLGLSEAAAQRMALQTVAGAAALAKGSDQSPAALADAVASPGGMTRLGMDVLDADERIVAMVTDTLRAARDRGAQLAALAAAND